MEIGGLCSLLWLCCGYVFSAVVVSTNDSVFVISPEMSELGSFIALRGITGVSVKK